MDRRRVVNLLANYYALLALSLIGGISLLPRAQAQVISPEMRRLCAASNQFGIDTLRALDRIEPPDKVLVFCPACLSSTLMMIMMGSSRYQVVSSLRQALYVWSMQPREINRGFRDIFQHIGLNQLPVASAKSRSQWDQQTEESSEHRRLQTESYSNMTQFSHRQGSLNDETKLRPIKAVPETRRRIVQISPINLINQDAISLPALIKLKALMERTVELQEPWWHSISKRSQEHRVQLDQAASSTTNRTVSFKEQRFSPNDRLESSQMSALSNIYIQRGLTMNYNYNLLLRQNYMTVIHPVDFLRNSEETRLHINSVVASNTENKIKDLVKRGTFELQPAPKIMMISTFHFRGTLDIEMKPRNKSKRSVTMSRRARSRAGRAINTSKPLNNKPQESKGAQFIETGSTPLKYGHFSSLACSVIEVPFDNRLVTLVIVMPDDKNSTDLLLTRLSAQILNDLVNSLVVKRLSLGIPVIKFDRGPLNMSGLLQELGLANVFHGDRSYSSETGLNRWLRPSDIVHETSIDIGTINPDQAQPESRLKPGAHEHDDSNHIKLDKPFFYFVMDSISGLILTMGRIRQ